MRYINPNLKQCSICRSPCNTIFTAVYRREDNSSNYLIEEVPQELEMESDEGLDIPEPVSEDSLEDDDLELLDALDEI